MLDKFPNERGEKLWSRRRQVLYHLVEVARLCFGKNLCGVKVSRLATNCGIINNVDSNSLSCYFYVLWNYTLSRRHLRSLLHSDFDFVVLSQNEEEMILMKEQPK